MQGNQIFVRSQKNSGSGSGAQMPIDVDKKVAGLLIPVFALRRTGDLGIGDTISFKDAIAFCARNDFAILQTLPINETSGDNSPYNAISAMALEPALLAMTPELVPGLTKGMIDSLISSDAASSLETDSIDYDRVKDIKVALLKEAFHAFEGEADKHRELHDEFSEFVVANAAWVTPYSVFRTLVDEHGGDPRWTIWQPELRQFESAVSWIEKSADRDRLKDSNTFWSYVQWVAHKQWVDVKQFADQQGVRVMGDVPFGISRYSSDVWQRQDLFDLEWSGGAPPEPFFHSDSFTAKWGQNWGIPLYKWEEHKKENYQWWRLRIKHLLQHFHDFRIDHVLGFFRVYAFPWIPERNDEFLELTEEEAEELTDGLLPGFRPRPDEPEEFAEENCQEGIEILSVLSDTAGDCNIVAEDLGVIVPEYLRPALHDDLKMAGFAIPIFERVEETREYKSPEELHPLSLATYATHDHQPIAAFYAELSDRWHSPDGHEGWLEVQRLMRFLGLDEENPPVDYNDTLYEAFAETLMNTPCWAALYMVTDLLGTSQRFNQPGISGAGCWTERLGKTLSEYEADPIFGPRIRLFKKIIGTTKRAPTARVVSSKGPGA